MRGVGWFSRRRSDPAWRRAPFLKTLSAAELDRIAPHVSERRLAPGEVFLREGEASRELYVVGEGTVEVARAGAGGASVVLGNVTTGGLLGEVSLFDRGARSGTARAVTASVVHAIPFDCLDGRRGGLAEGARLRVLAGVGEAMAARVRSGGEASAEAARRGEAMAQFLVSVMTLQCIYAITLTALPHLADWVPLSTSYVSIPLQLIFAVGGIAFIFRTGLPLASFGLGLRDLFGSLALATAVTAPFLGVLTGVKWAVLLVKGKAALPVIENPDVAAVVAQPHVQKLLLIYGVSCLVQEIIVRSALQSSLHIFLTSRHARLRAVFVCALVFATNHLHMSGLFAAAAMLPGLVWGWMFAVKRNVAGVTLSHFVVGAYVFFVLGVNVG